MGYRYQSKPKYNEEELFVNSTENYDDFATNDEHEKETITIIGSFMDIVTLGVL